MKASDLHSVWSMPDNSRLTSKQYSFRLPVHVAAKLSALCDLYPGKNRTQIVADLLATAIDSAAEGLPAVKGSRIDRLRDGDVEVDFWEDVGLGAKYKALANNYYKELERELGNEEPGVLYQHNYMTANVEGSYSTFAIGEEVER